MPPSRKPPRTPQTWTLWKTHPNEPLMWTPQPQKTCAKNRKKHNPGDRIWHPVEASCGRGYNNKKAVCQGAPALKYYNMMSFNLLPLATINHLSLTFLLESIHVPSWGKCSGVHFRQCLIPKCLRILIPETRDAISNLGIWSLKPLFMPCLDFSQLESSSLVGIDSQKGLQ